jgi:hypothetical protein
MVARFSLYDFIAVVIPGILFIWAISLFSDSIGIAFYIPLAGGIAETSVLIALAYVTGLILQGISQGVTEKVLIKIWGGFPSARWLLPDDTRFEKGYKDKIKQIVEKNYGIKSENNLSRKEQLKKNQEIFYLCYNAVDKEKLSDRPQIFNAHYGLFRCLLTTFLILFLLGIVTLIFNKKMEHTILYLILLFSFIGASVSYFRAMKRGEDFAKSIYDLFLVQFSE